MSDRIRGVITGPFLRCHGCDDEIPADETGEEPETVRSILDDPSWVEWFCPACRHFLEKDD